MAAQVFFGVFDSVVYEAVKDLVLDAHHGVQSVHRGLGNQGDLGEPCQAHLFVVERD